MGGCRKPRARGSKAGSVRGCSAGPCPFVGVPRPAASSTMTGRVCVGQGLVMRRSGVPLPKAAPQVRPYVDHWVGRRHSLSWPPREVASSAMASSSRSRRGRPRGSIGWPPSGSERTTRNGYVGRSRNTSVRRSAGCRSAGSRRTSSSSSTPSSVGATITAADGSTSSTARKASTSVMSTPPAASAPRSPRGIRTLTTPANFARAARAARRPAVPVG